MKNTGERERIIMLDCLKGLLIGFAIVIVTYIFICLMSDRREKRGCRMKPKIIYFPLSRKCSERKYSDDLLYKYYSNNILLYNEVEGLEMEMIKLNKDKLRLEVKLKGLENEAQTLKNELYTLQNKE